MAGTGCCSEIESLLLLQTICYSALSIIVTVITICMGTVYHAQMDCQCPLFANLSWHLDSNTTASSSDSNCTVSIDSQSSNCQFIISTHIIELLYVVCVTIYHIVVFYKSTTNHEVVNNLLIKPFIVFNCIISVLTLVMASIISAGLHTLCNQFNQDKSINSCRDLQHIKYWELSKVNASDCIIDLEIAQGSIWLGFFVWVAILALSIIRHMKNQRNQSTRNFATDVMLEDSTHGDDHEETILFDGYRRSHTS